MMATIDWSQLATMDPTAAVQYLSGVYGGSSMDPSAGIMPGVDATGGGLIQQNYSVVNPNSTGPGTYSAFYGNGAYLPSTGDQLGGYQQSISPGNGWNYLVQYDPSGKFKGVVPDQVHKGNFWKDALMGALGVAGAGLGMNWAFNPMLGLGGAGAGTGAELAGPTWTMQDGLSMTQVGATTGASTSAGDLATMTGPWATAGGEAGTTLGDFGTLTGATDLSGITATDLAAAGGGAAAAAAAAAGAGGLSWGNILGDTLKIGSSVIPLLAGAKMISGQKDAATAGQNMNPWYQGPGGQFAASQLLGLLKDPSSITSMPGYDSGLQAVQRTDAAQGYQGGGKMATDIANYGGTFYTNYLNTLAGLSGANAPSTSAQGAAATNAANANLMSIYGLMMRSLGDLGNTVLGSGGSSNSGLLPIFS